MSLKASDITGKKSKKWHLSSPFWVVNNTYKYANINIAKNACTSLKCITFLSDLQKDSSISIKELLKKYPSSRQWGISNSVLQYTKIPEDYIKFAVYRDPIERYYSAINNNKSLYDTCAKDDCYLNMTDTGGNINQHVRPQSEFYREFQVDYIVKIEDLDDFLKKVLHVDEKYIFHRNSHSHKFSPKEEDIALLKEYYKNDYKILDSPKLWKNL